MILQCPECSAKFKIPDGALGEDGRVVRCGKCAHNWKAMPEQEGDALEAVEALLAKAKAELDDDVVGEDGEEKDLAPDIDEVLAGKTYQAKTASKKKKSKSELMEEAVMGDYKPPVPVKRRKMMVALYWTINVGLCAVIALLWSLLEKPEWYGFTSSSGLAFEELELEPMAQIGGDRFTMNPLFRITGTVRNISDEPKRLPKIRITLKDSNNELVYRKSHVDDQVIPAGDTIEFVMENLEQAERRHTHFVVEMGNPMELTMRDVELTNAN